MAGLKPGEIDAIIQGNPGMWFETDAQIRGSAGKLEKPRMNILQRRINALYVARRRKNRACYAIGLKPRKRGFSTMVAALHYTELSKNGFNACIVGNKLETSDTVFRMMRTYQDNDDLVKAGKWGSPAKWTTEKASWEHGSTLAQSTAMNGESIRGQTQQLLHGTEVAHWQNADTVLLALMNAVPDDPSASVWLESTPNGTGNAFHKTWEGARWPAPDECPDRREYWRYWATDCPDNPNSIFAEHEFVRVFAAWFEFDEAVMELTDEQRAHIMATLDDRAWYQGERELITKYGNTRESDGAQRLGLEIEEGDVWDQLAWRRATIKKKCGGDPKKFDQEYPRDPASCFLASGSPVFDTDAVAEYAASARGIAPEYGSLQLSRDQVRAVFIPAAKDTASFQVWEKPKKGCSYLISVDTAEGEDQTKGEDPDRHSVLVWRRAYVDGNRVNWKPRLVARIPSPCQVPIPALVELVKLLHLYYGRAVCIPEMNSSGLAFLLLAQKVGITIWKRKDFDPKSGKTEERLGWRTTDGADYGGLRTLIIENLALTLRNRGVHIACENVIHELGKFVRNEGRMQAAQNEHDDDVLSTAIGLYNLDAATVFEEPVVERQLPPDLQALEDGQSERNGLAMNS